MYFFDRKLSLLLLLISLPLLFLPKINLLHFSSGETAGLRIDDIALFITGVILSWSHAFSHQNLYRVEGWILAITGFSLLSFLLNQLFVALGIVYMDAKIFYALRLMEYFLFFYVGAMASQILKEKVIVQLFFLWNFCLILLQKFQLAGGITATGYLADISGRVQGIASFPSEMGLLLNLFFCYLIFDPLLNEKIKQFSSSSPLYPLIQQVFLYGLFFLFGILIIFTGNRISIVALLFCFLFRLKQEFSLRSAFSLLPLFLFIPLMGIAIGWVIVNTPGIYERSLALFSFKNFELLPLIWDKIDISYSPIGQGVIGSENYDMSWWLRAHKWLFITKSYACTPECYLQGLGPGFAGAALDGGILRIMTEYGLIGVFLFWKFFIRLANLNPQTYWMMIAFLINMIFFDAYLAYKSMSFLLFTCGSIFQRQIKSLELPCIA